MHVSAALNPQKSNPQVLWIPLSLQPSALRCCPHLPLPGVGAGLACRTNMCYDESASIVVMVTDTCPCTYPTNYSSNKRWCCGDMYHLDLSIWAYEKVSNAFIITTGVRQVCLCLWGWRLQLCLQLGCADPDLPAGRGC
jgi:hypothetical protein